MVTDFFSKFCKILWLFLAITTPRRSPGGQAVFWSKIAHQGPLVWEVLRHSMQTACKSVQDQLKAPNFIIVHYVLTRTYIKSGWTRKFVWVEKKGVQQFSVTHRSQDWFASERSAQSRKKISKELEHSLYFLLTSSNRLPWTALSKLKYRKEASIRLFWQ